MYKGFSHTLALPVAQLTEMALGPAIVRCICEGSLPVVLSAAIPVVTGRKSVAGLRLGSQGCVYGACTPVSKTFRATEAHRDKNCDFSQACVVKVNQCTKSQGSGTDARCNHKVSRHAQKALRAYLEICRDRYDCCQSLRQDR